MKHIRLIPDRNLFKLSIFLIVSNIFLSACAEKELATTPRLYLQQVGHSSAIVRWRGSNDDVYYGVNSDELTLLSSGSNISNDDYQAQLTGLASDTSYYYRLGAGAGMVEQTFLTAPEPGQVPKDGSTRVWIIGDSGTANDDARAVRDAYYNFNDGEPSADVFVMLGDNAYNEGTDVEYQVAVFDIFDEILKTTAIWPTIGNHDTRDGLSIGGTLFNAPYLSIFSLPEQGEMGGVPSGTEQYYSFDQGNVHFICLDSQSTIKDEAKLEAMKTWLIDDLSASKGDWNIVFFHHPPYSKGSHDTDDLGLASLFDKKMIDMREQFTPVFDEYGVDLVFTGHSHSYERSYYVNGHTGNADTFDAHVHGELNTSGVLKDGREDGTGVYTQISDNGLDDKVVYSVVGSSGKVNNAALDHPVQFVALASLGSVVLDIDQHSIQAKFLDENGAIKDYYMMTRD